LIPHYGADCPVVIAYRVTWPDQLILRGDLAGIREQVKAAGITRTALILVGRALGSPDYPDSALYDATHTHVLRQ
jgi:precorrin-4/cobalt-precorrin-4 C11-methyltransferase